MFALFAATTLRLFFKLRKAVAHLFALTVDVRLTTGIMKFLASAVERLVPLI